MNSKGCIWREGYHYRIAHLVAFLNCTITISTRVISSWLWSRLIPPNIFFIDTTSRWCSRRFHVCIQFVRRDYFCAVGSTKFTWEDHSGSNVWAVMHRCSTGSRGPTVAHEAAPATLHSPLKLSGRIRNDRNYPCDFFWLHFFFRLVALFIYMGYLN